MNRVCQEIFSSLRNSSGRPYDTNHYQLHVSDDGEVSVVPKFYNSTVKCEVNTTAAYSLLDLSMKG